MRHTLLALLLATIAAGTADGCAGTLVRGEMGDTTGCARKAPGAGTGCIASALPPETSPIMSQAAEAELIVRIRWPEALPARGVSTIPPSAKSIRINVRDNDAIVATVGLTRGGTAEASVSFRFKPISQATVEAWAFRIAAPPLASASAIAVATSTGRTFAPATRTLLSLALTPLEVPAVEEIMPAFGLAEDLVRIRGRFLGTVDGMAPAVFFAGTPAAVVIPVDDTMLDAQVPAGAKVGHIVVSSDGRSSATSNRSVFWAATAVRIKAARQSWDTIEGVRTVVGGSSIQLYPDPEWSFRAGEADDLYGDPPELGAIWQTTNSAAGSISSGGLFTAGTAGATTSITATLGEHGSTALEIRVVGSAPQSAAADWRQASTQRAASMAAVEGGRP